MLKRDLHLERTYPYPPERLWRALTDSKAMNEWLMANDFQPIVGHKFQFHTRPAPTFDGTVYCEVLEVDRPRRLVYSWRSGQMRQPTIVTWTLEPIAEGTHLTLSHTGFEGLWGIAVSMILNAGWKRLLGSSIFAALKN
jgi:uncharacterized protein YndB with AHSA1/START domain